LFFFDMMSTDSRKYIALTVLAVSIGTCGYFIWKVLWSDKEKSKWQGPNPKNLRVVSLSSSLDDQKNAEFVELDNSISKKSSDLCLQTELMNANINFDSGEDPSDVEPVLTDKHNDFTVSNIFEKQDSGSIALELDSKYPNDDLKMQPMVRYKSCIADLFEVSEARELGHFIGVKPVDLCWLRGDEGNASTDYHETMGITWQHLETINAAKTSFDSEYDDFEVPQITSDEFRNLKSKLAVAFIDAMPTCRRNISLLSLGVDKIWREVTEIKRGEVRVDMAMFNKELSWLKSKKKRQQISLRQYNSLLASVEDVFTPKLSSVSLDYGEGRCSRLEISPCLALGRARSWGSKHNAK